MDLSLVGPGRAGLALTLAARAAGHRIVAVLARDPEAAVAAAARLEAPVMAWDAALPKCELLLVAVRDDAIAAVARHFAAKVGAVGGAVHLSGLTPVTALDALPIPIGSFHPLQTLPTPESGAARLSGAWIAVTTEDDLLADLLFAFASSLGAHPFELADDQKPLYHAAAAAAANFPLAALAMSERLFTAAGVDFAAAGPLVAAVVANAAEMGPEAALTGPVARGDVGTVRAQVAAVAAAAPDLLEHFVAMIRATAAVAGTSDAIEQALS
ncbi:MAG: hypothetical protein A2135_07460 [Actinobacteria bacterium RBG_16_67_15]|nr:MAG: hypothetical protein A2135_07460 [Actinobacteria bacterium RBG_16_67_15]